ncbi:phosphoglycerate dehydrogenase [Actinobaculum sp. 352]|nr:phosphoglycerate dehydrogenase [Actinobaculum sp. 352]
MSMSKVIVTARSFGKTNDEAEQLLREHGCDVVRINAGTEAVEQQVRREIVDADAVVAGLEEYDADVIASARNLKVISRYGVGYDKVDVEAAKARGIAVTFTPGANGDSVADLAVTLMLSAARNICYMNRTLQRPSGLEMYQKTLGVIGVGRIGKGVARRCRGFDMDVLLYDAFYQDQEFADAVGGKFVDLETLIRESDFISIHANLNDSTHNMFSTAQFRAMKSTAVLVNTARGGIVDEDALYDALRDGEIYAAALDAVADESNEANNRLRELDNCILTPHAGAATREASAKMSLMAAQNVVDVLESGTCANLVPPLR